MLFWCSYSDLQCLMRAHRIGYIYFPCFLGGALQSGSTGSGGSLFLWLSNSHRECSLRDVQFANRHLHQRSQEKVLLLRFYLLGYVNIRKLNIGKDYSNMEV